MGANPNPSARGGEPVEASSAASLCLLLGRMLFGLGATAQRVHDSIGFLARHLGCKVDVLVSYDALLITVNDGAAIRTRIDSSQKVAGLDLLGLMRVSQLLRDLPQSQPGPQEIERALCAIRDTPPRHGFAWQAIAAGCAGAGFCIVNGGDPASWVGTFIASAVIFSIRRQLARRNLNVQLTFFAVALVGSFLAGLLARLMQTSTPVVALVAPVLFLVPGVPLINGGIDIVRNHVTIGIARIGFTMAVLVSLCLGAGVSLRMLPMPLTPAFSLPSPWDTVLFASAGAVAAGALACLNNGGFALITLCAVGGLTGRLVRALISLSGVDVVTASLVGVLCSTLAVTFIADRFRWPAVVASVMAALPMVPGYFAIGGINLLMTFAVAGQADPAQLSAGVQAITRAIFISIALVVGVIGPVVTLQRDKERV